MLQFPYPVSKKLVASHLEKIHFLAKVLESVPVPTSVATAVFHRQVLKSSVFSARIEGNTLTLSDVESKQLSESDKQKKEIDNCMRALRSIKTLGSSLSVASITSLHAQVMEGLHHNAGKLRSEQSAIFDSFGTVVYLTPDTITLQQMLELFLFESNKQQETEERLIDIGRRHYYFEKMHPFFDGNGRTGRILIQWELQQTKLFGDYILPIDEYFETHRSAYYAYLEQNTRHCEEFSSFVLEGIVWALEMILSDLKKAGKEQQFSQATGTEKTHLPLLPRREEILAIITDHPYAPFDLIARRFTRIPQRTLAYDIQWLVKNGYVFKHGSTRGVRYSRKNES